MENTITLRGVPRRLALDGWWLDSATQTAGSDGGDTTRGTGLAGNSLGGRLGLLALVLLADVLFWRYAPGLSLAVFASAIFAVAARNRPSPRSVALPALLLLVGAAPSINHVQPLSVIFLGAALIVALVWSQRPALALTPLLVTSLRYLGHLPLSWIEPFRLRAWQGKAAILYPRRFLRDWAFPLGGSLVIAALLMDANPIFLRVISVDFAFWDLAERALFWSGIALLTAPFLRPEMPLADLPALPDLGRLPGMGINARSVLRALVMFNLLIAVQMLTDASILLAGAQLPPGMSHAEYAHRGAYPLLATAMLAGGFALAARPYWGEHALIRPLLLLWLAQNVILCGAAALRLELYIGAFGLTYLRLYALIWMALVAAGLTLVGWQMVQRRDSLWMVLRAAALGLATLYLCSFVNFAQIIAAQNLTRVSPDMRYVCALGPMASGTVLEALAARPELRWPGYCAARRVPALSDWREWGFRGWAVARKVNGTQTAEGLIENPVRR